MLLMKTPNQRSDLIRRLQCAAGHLNTVIEMTEEGRPCEQVLHQLNVVQCALRAAGVKLIASQIHSSQTVILDSSSIEERISELRRIQSLYVVFTHYSKYHNEVSHD